MKILKSITVICVYWFAGIALGCLLALTVSALFHLNESTSTLVGYSLGAVCGAAGAWLGSDKALD